MPVNKYSVALNFQSFTMPGAGTINPSADFRQYISTSNKKSIKRWETPTSISHLEFCGIYWKRPWAQTFASIANLNPATTPNIPKPRGLKHPSFLKRGRIIRLCPSLKRLWLFRWGIFLFSEVFFSMLSKRPLPIKQLFFLFLKIWGRRRITTSNIGWRPSYTSRTLATSCNLIEGYGS